MGKEMVMVFTKVSPTEGSVICPCGMCFPVDSISERNMTFDRSIMRLRAVCPRCSRLEPFYQFSDGPTIRSGSPAPGRIKELFHE
jgi:hypothetical protein